MKMKKHRTGLFYSLCAAFSILVLSLAGCTQTSAPQAPVSADSIPAYTDQAYVALNGNAPAFTEEEITDDSFETYYDLDALGRVTGAFASIGPDLLPTKEREISRA